MSTVFDPNGGKKTTSQRMRDRYVEQQRDRHLAEAVARTAQQQQGAKGPAKGVREAGTKPQAPASHVPVNPRPANTVAQPDRAAAQRAGAAYIQTKDQAEIFERQIVQPVRGEGVHIGNGSKSQASSAAVADRGEIQHVSRNVTTTLDVLSTAARNDSLRVAQPREGARSLSLATESVAGPPTPVSRDGNIPRADRQQIVREGTDQASAHGDPQSHAANPLVTASAAVAGAVVAEQSSTGTASFAKTGPNKSPSVTRGAARPYGGKAGARLQRLESGRVGSDATDAVETGVGDGVETDEATDGAIAASPAVSAETTHYFNEEDADFARVKGASVRFQREVIKERLSNYQKLAASAASVIDRAIARLENDLVPHPLSERILSEVFRDQIVQGNFGSVRGRKAILS